MITTYLYGCIIYTSYTTNVVNRPPVKCVCAVYVCKYGISCPTMSASVYGSIFFFRLNLYIFFFIYRETTNRTWRKYNEFYVHIFVPCETSVVLRIFLLHTYMHRRRVVFWKCIFAKGARNERLYKRVRFFYRFLLGPPWASMTAPETTKWLYTNTIVGITKKNATVVSVFKLELVFNIK